MGVPPAEIETLVPDMIAPAGGLNVGVGHAGSVVAPDIPDMPLIATVPDIPVIAIVPDMPLTEPLLPDIEPLPLPMGLFPPPHPTTAP
jgi:hypothetical protein